MTFEVIWAKSDEKTGSKLRIYVLKNESSKTLSLKWKVSLRRFLALSTLALGFSLVAFQPNSSYKVVICRMILTLGA